ncbi:MAG: hypothetical protein K1000chlam3_00223 [Chlamydiae bacterium]|nr:hypothetical protein [Chlamydiota bacterium]
MIHIQHEGLFDQISYLNETVVGLIYNKQYDVALEKTKEAWQLAKEDLNYFNDEYFKSLNNFTVILNKKSESSFDKEDYNAAFLTAARIMDIIKTDELERSSSSSSIPVLYEASLKHQSAISLNLQAKVFNEQKKYKEASAKAKQAQQMAESGLVLNQNDLKAGLLFQVASALFYQTKFEQAIAKAKEASQEAIQTLKTTLNDENYKDGVQKIIESASKLYDEAEQYLEATSSLLLFSNKMVSTSH